MSSTGLKKFGKPSSARPDAAGLADRYAAARPLEFEPDARRRNHHVFRYPAKFHAPVAGKLVELFSEPGQTILDPFCGSGTLLVEAAVRGRHSWGSDIDPLAAFVAQAKTGITDFAAIADAAAGFAFWIDEQRTIDESRWGSFEKDISGAEYLEAKSEVEDWIPDLPRIEHWFRRRATLQLAAIRKRIATSATGDAELFLSLCFASIIRGSSNADPVPISGLEVTSHMLEKERRGRSVDPWTLMRKTLDRSLTATKAFIDDRTPGVRCDVEMADARHLEGRNNQPVDAVITSPPYLTAVDYYRRHTLEMYWLGLTGTAQERLQLAPRYIGRDRIGAKHLPIADLEGIAVADAWLPRFGTIRPERARAFRHYCDGMARTLGRAAGIVVAGGPIVIVAGDVRFCGKPVSMLELMKDLAPDSLMIADHLWYPISNRYMSYARNNEANIAADHVIVFRDRSGDPPNGR